MIIIGLTGILGSGKSTVAALLRKRGLEVIDLDALARDSLNWKETQDDIKRAFGPEYVIDGTVDVKRLREVAFTKEHLRMLEAIIHPRIIQETRGGSMRSKKRAPPRFLSTTPFFLKRDFTGDLTRSSWSLRPWIPSGKG